MSAFTTVAHPLYGFPITIAPGISVSATDAVIKSFSDPNSKFSKWLVPCRQNGIDIRGVTIDAVTMFGPNIGFLYFTAQAYDIENNPIPGTVFLRGDSVCCLLIVKEIGGTNTEPIYHMVVVEEIKIPVSAAIMQTPAGMLDYTNNIKGKMIDEIKEETGIVIKNAVAHYNTLIGNEPPLDTLIEFDEFYPSQGGCDEKLKVFSYLCEMNAEELGKINGALTGKAAEFERIKVHILPLRWEIIDNLKDSKLLVSACKFDRKFPGIIKR